MQFIFILQSICLCTQYPVQCGSWPPHRTDMKPETDPTGKSPNNPGAKLDAGKPLHGSVLLDFSKALEEVGKVGTFGAAKYTLQGWLRVPDGHRRYTDALFRHLLREGAGETFDADSGLSHAAHAAWNALARLELAIRQRKYRRKNKCL